MPTKEELVEDLLEALEPDNGWDVLAYMQVGNLLAATLPEIIKRVEALRAANPVDAEPPLTLMPQPPTKFNSAGTFSSCTSEQAEDRLHRNPCKEIDVPADDKCPGSRDTQPITEALTDEQFATVEDEIEEARRRG